MSLGDLSEPYHKKRRMDWTNYLHTVKFFFFITELSGILNTLGSSSGKGSVSMHPNAGQRSPRSRAIAEAILSLHLVNPLVSKLKSDGLYHIFTNVEMPSIGKRNL